MEHSWYYNRLSNASATFPPGSGANASDYHQQLAGHPSEGNAGASPASASQLLQFNSGFLPPNPYPFYNIPPASKTGPYAAVGQTRSSASTSKPTSEGRENYNPAHHQSSVSSTTYFDHQNTAPAAGSIDWSHHNPHLATQGAFGVLPHESISSSSTSPKTGSTDYPFNSYSSHNAGHLTPADYKNSGNYPEGKKATRSQSPVSSTKTGFASYPGSSANLSNYSAHESNNRTGYSSTDKFIGSAPIHQQQSQSSKDFEALQSSRTVNSNPYQETNISREKEGSSRSPSFSSPNIKMSHPTKAQSKLYPDVPNSSASSPGAEVTRNSEHNSSSSQRYASDTKQASGPTQHVPGTASFYDSLNFPYHYPLPDAATFNRMKSISSELYLASQAGGSDCGKKTSTQVSQPPAGAVEHVTRPSYAMYNSAVTSLPSTSPHQHERSTSCNQNSSSANSYKPAAPTNSGDATVRMESVQHQNVAYPSVITRAVTTPETVSKPNVYSDTRLYDRIQDPTSFSKQCWETGSEKLSAASQSPDSSSHQKKYHSSPVPTYDSSSTDMTSNMRQQTSRSSVSATEKQNSYYDSNSAHQTALQNLSSYRDDPMSIIKDLQQQNYQSLQNIDSSKPGEKLSVDQSANSNVKRKKRVDKHVQNNENSDFYNNRVPPPAHNNATFQQQQSGSYFPNFSPPSTSRSYPVPQVPMHYAPHSLVGQHQGIYPPSFFPPFQLPGQSSTPTPSTSSSSPSVSSTAPQSPAAIQQSTSSSVSEKSYPDDFVPAPNRTSSQTQPQQTPPVEVTPKVIVPNVEEELSFLQDAGPVTMIKSEDERKKIATSGFEASFLKFLQGERESSPPPQNRSRKSSYVKANRNELAKQSKPDATTSTLTNGGSGKTAVIPTSPVMMSNTAKDKTKAAYDPKDDPRYFPLPKTDAEREVSSDSDSDDGSFSTTPVKNVGSKSQDRKPVAAVAPRTASSKQVAKATAVTTTQPGKRGRKRKSEAISVPRRETSKRKAKEKGSILLDDGEDEYSGRTKEGTDSDSDPAWTPMHNKPKNQNLDSSEEDNSKKKSHKKGTKLSGQGRKRSKYSRSDDDAASTDDEKSKKHSISTGLKGRRRSSNIQGTSGNSNSAKSGDDNEADGDAEMYPFKIGEFIVMKTDLNEKWPPIWRVDGKTLLQKFEPFEQKGAMLYRNISTYSGWSPQNGHIYKSAEVVFKVQTRSETVVEFLRDEMADDDDDVLVEFVKETAKYQENFEVYIQTLISQALDSNFLTEIFQEKDEYFLSNVKTVDNIVDDRRKRFLQVVKWRPELEASIATWPCYNVIYEMVKDEPLKKCAACDKANVFARVLLYGQPYNSTTLEGCQPDPRLASEKDFLTCRLCLKRIELYNKVAHQKYLMYIECAKRVNERKLAYGFNDTTLILNKLLADENWLNQLFRSVRISWAQMDRLEHSLSKN